MKKKNLFIIFPLLLTFTACNEPQVNVKRNIVNTILNGVNVKIAGHETIIYPDQYSFLSTTNTIDIDRDYKLIKEENNTFTPAIRENTDYNFTTYLRGEDGQAIREVLTADNKVTTTNLKINNQDVLFKEKFANPFDYIDEEDIGDDYSLDITKATILVENYTGYKYGVKSAKFVVEENVATSLDIEFFDRIDGLEVDDGFLSINNSLELDIKFSYSLSDINHLSVRPEADETLKNAFNNNNNNYTMTFSSDASTTNTIVYITSNAVFIHEGIDVIGASDNDVYYKKTGDNKYDKYVYKASKGKFTLSDFDVNENTFLPNLVTLSPNILVKESNDIYKFDNVSAMFGLEKMILPKYPIETGLGVKGSLILENGNFSILQATFNELSPFTITQNYYNHGSTTMPSWLDVESIK